ncbi:hypothetical protein O6H91_Y067000 [Diphasiastrum complanatum]|nr:hypothetical protein O6H91_Y067000 [Diphasiastrum complanatum]
MQILGRFRFLEGGALLHPLFGNCFLLWLVPILYMILLDVGAFFVVLTLLQDDFGIFLARFSILLVAFMPYSWLVPYVTWSSSTLGSLPCFAPYFKKILVASSPPIPCWIFGNIGQLYFLSDGLFGGSIDTHFIMYCLLDFLVLLGSTSSYLAPYLMDIWPHLHSISLLDFLWLLGNTFSYLACYLEDILVLYFVDILAASSQPITCWICFDICVSYFLGALFGGR